jgi:hypothetical protein
MLEGSSMSRLQRKRLVTLYERVRPMVEKRWGRGALSERKFIEMSRRGKALMRKRKVARDSLAKKLADLERRVARLEKAK